VADEPPDEKDFHRDESNPASKGRSASTGHAALATERDDLAPLSEIQQRTLRRTQLLKLKAEAELARVEKSPPPDAGQKRRDPTSGKEEPRDTGPSKQQPVDPKQLRAGYQKAIELAPRAVEQMERAVKLLKQKDPQTAYPPAEKARKILEEILKAQPRQDQQDQNKKNEDQQKKDQKDQQKNHQQKKDQQKDAGEKQDQQKKDQDEQKKQQEPNQPDQKQQDQKQPQPQVSRDRIEEALRQVRERQQDKRERDRRMKARVFGRLPVEKDW
jgi:hypothetical protein